MNEAARSLREAWRIMRTTQTRLRTRLAAVIGMLAIALSTLLGVGAATAAPPYATEGTITSADFTAETVQSGSAARIDATWSIADNATPPAGFVVDLPADLQGRTASFPLKDEAGVTMGQCTVTATQIYCDLDAAYLAENPRDVHGNLNFWVKVTTEVTEATETTYDIGDAQATTTVTPAPGACTTDCGFTGRTNYKWGAWDASNGTISWGVVVKAPAEGMAGGQQVVVTDHPGPDQEIARVWLVRTNELAVNGQGKLRPANWKTVPTSQYTVSADRSTVTFTSQQGYFYEVRYSTKPTDGGASQTYSNSADISIAGQKTVQVNASVQSQGGGGTGTGTNVGRFSITKEVTGSGAAQAEGLTFSGTYVVRPPSGDTIEGTFEVTDGATWTSDEFPRGSTVELTEITPTEPANVAWADPVFSQPELTLSGGTTTVVTLTNEATLLTGAFSVTKVLDGNGASRVPADATFTVEYSYAAGPGFEGGAGELVVPADGTVVTSGQLPAGAEVTLTEVAPASVDGLTWESATFSPTTVTVGAGEVVEVTLTNTVTRTPTVDETTSERPPSEAPSTGGTPPSTGGTPPSSGLPETGADVSLPALVGALMLIAAGAALLALRRRQQQ